ncbi:MAG: DNA repair protein RecO C-terminal domain-containing protein, partial [Verrucomicrobiota bacterium]
KLDLFYFADFSFQRSRRTELHNLREVVLRETHSALRRELGYLQQASYCTALIEQTTETETPLDNIFQLLSDLLAHLPSRPPRPLTIFEFEMRLLNELGLKPNLRETNLSAGAKQILQKVVDLDCFELSRIELSKAQVAEIRQFLHASLIFHFGKTLKGRTSVVGN